MQTFLGDCHRIEELAGKTYLLLARTRTLEKEVREVFKRLSADEQSHARHLDLVKQTPAQQVDVIPGISRDKVREARMLAEQMFFLADRGGLTEEKALKMAVQMEEEFIKIHVHNSLHFYDRNLAELFERLRAEDQDHIDALNHCLKLWRRRNLAQQKTAKR